MPMYHGVASDGRARTVPPPRDKKKDNNNDSESKEKE